jgi:hypothetical protein
VRASLLLVSLLSALLALPPNGDVTASHSSTHWGFEDDGDFVAWRVDGGSMEPVTSRVAEGERAARLTVDEGSILALARAFLQVALQPGGTYRLSGRALVDGPNVRWFWLEIAWEEPGGRGGRTRSVPIDSTGGSYRELSTPQVLLPCDVVAAGIAIVLQREPRAGSAYAYVDDVRLELVAPPAPCPTPTSPPAPPGPPSSPDLSPAPTGPGSSDPQAPGPGAATTLPASSRGLLVNGGFEAAAAGRPVGWRSYGGALTQVATPVRSGRFAGAFSSSSDSTKWIYQALPVTPGAWYQLDGYVYLDDPRAEAALLRVSWYTSADGSGLAVGTVDSTAQLEQPQGRYRYLTTGPVQAPPGVHSAKARVLLRPRSAAGTVIYIDDVSFRPAAPDAVSSGSESAGGSGGGGARSGALGLANQSDAFPLTPLPAPVLVRSSRLRAQDESPSGGGTMWWPWAVAGGAVLLGLGGAGWGAWRWRRQRPG